MDHVKQLIIVSFRLINFAVLIALILYLVKKYGLPLLAKSMQEHKDYFLGLTSTHQRLKKEQQLLEKKIVDDQQEQFSLKERLMRWLASVDDQKKKLHALKDERKKMLKERMLFQQKQVARHRLYHAVMADALAQARNTLENQSATPQAQKEMFDAIAQALKER